jgi:fatty-acyl-CoA synthase
MIIVDKQRYGKQFFLSAFNEMASQTELKNPEGRQYAICLKHPLEVICLLLYLRDRSGSILLLSGNVPFETAKEMAEKAQCNYLVYGQLGDILPIGKMNHYPTPSIFQYSSGTTGEPKLIARSWKDVELEIESYNQRLAASEPPIVLVPVSHSFGLITGVLAGMRRETEPIIVHDKNPRFAIHIINSTERSMVYGVPFLYHLMDTLGKGELRYDKIISSGAPLAESLLTRLKQNAREVWQQYGCTEAGCISIGNSPTSFSDVGNPLSHLQVTTIDSPDSDEPLGTVSEIVALSGANKIYTHDHGYISEQGALHVLGRMDDVINVSGLKVIPSEVESIIGRMQGVRETVVYKTKHKVWGEAVKALIVASNAVQCEEVKIWCATHLPAYKVPSVIEIVREIPKLPSGKISRKLLIERERNV